MSTYDTQNIFAKILRGEIPCDKVFENDHALAFNDIAPQAPIHVLVIPKGAYIDLTDFSRNAPVEEQTAFFKAIDQLVEQLGLTEGYRSICNSGANSNQEVPHFHMHILGGKNLGELGD